jgi:hypothetical protein
MRIETDNLGSQNGPLVVDNACVSGAMAPSDAIDEKGPASRAETSGLIDRRDSSRGATFVAIMQPTDLWKRDDLASRSYLDGARVLTILV